MGMIGTTLGHYRIVERIGVGGMGEVYRARDERLDRDVAIKVLPEAVANDPERMRRFEREAKALAALNHPNIATVYGFESDADADSDAGVGPSPKPRASSPKAFLVMELLEGESLRQRIPSAGLGWHKAVEIGAAVADGLAAAHGKGIVHRDLKPENIFITADGRVKILDFGLAQIREPVEDDAETATMTPAGTVPGTVMGTVGYMSPEQVRGQASDARSDIFALGCVLYEMLTGRIAFARDTTADTQAAILREEPPSLFSTGVTLPAELERSVARCLEKSPDARFQSASDLAYNLRSITTDHVVPIAMPVRGKRVRWLTAAGALIVVAAIAIVLGTSLLTREAPAPEGGHQPIRSIALLPLENLTGDPGQDYFVDGLHGELITTFAQIAAFDKVIARQSVMRFRDSNTPIREIGRQFGVAGVLEGSVRQSGDIVLVTVRLIDAGSESLIWSDSFERDLTDILSLQGDVAEAVAKQVKLSLTWEEQQRLTDRRAVNDEAYRAYLKGVRLSRWGAVTPDDLEQAQVLFRSALVLDPEFAHARFGLSFALFQLGRLYRDSNEYMPLAYREAVKAIELDDNLAEALAVIGAIKLLWSWEWESAGRDLQRASEMNPSDYLASQHLAYYWIAVGEPSDAVEVAREALERDPFNVRLMGGLGFTYSLARRFDDGIRQMRGALELYPYDPMLNWDLAMNLVGAGRHHEAANVMNRILEDAPLLRRNGLFLAALSGSQAAAGFRAEALENLAELEKLRRTGYVPPSSMSIAYLYVGDRDRAIAFLEQAVEIHDTQLLFYVVSYLADPLRDDPRFEECLRKMNLPARRW
jgi:TolB-like protein/Flp pilus assembly protein TadD